MSAPLKDFTGVADRETTEELLKRLPKGDLLLGYQRRTVDELYAGTALLVIEKSRRIGLTWGLAAYVTLRAAARVSAGGQSGWYMGYDKDMAREFIDVCAMWARAFGLAAAAVEEEVVEDEHGAYAAFSIRFSSGLKVTALPCVPRALRGKQGIVILDEAAFFKDLAEALKAAMALLIWGGQVIIVSTHDGVANPFKQLIDDIEAGKKRGRSLRITFADALADGLYERVAMVAAQKGVELPPKAQWEAEIRASYGEDAEEELDCIPKAGSGCLINPEDIAACEHDDCGRPELYAGGLLYIGRDVARRRDGAIIKGMEAVGDVLWERDHYREYGATFAHQDAYFDDLFVRRRVAKAQIDQTGMGEKVVEDAQLRHGSSRVNGVLLTGPNRLDLAISLQQRFERRLIRIRKDARTRADLRAIKKSSTKTGGVSIVNEGEVHADEFWAYALASRAADVPYSEWGYAGHARAADDRRRHSGEAFFFDDDDDDRRQTGRHGAGAW